MRLLAPMALVALVLAAVVWLDDVPEEADLVFVNQSEVFTLDPQRMSYIQDLRLAHALYEGLVRWDNHEFSILPAGAAVPDLSPDGRTYTFHLEPEAKWSNGDPVTAHDYAFAWQRALLPDTAADYSNLFFAIEGAEAFFDWRSNQLAAFAADDTGDVAERSERAATLWQDMEDRFRATVAVEVVDEHTLRVTLVRPTAYFLDLICFGVFFPVHRPCVEGWPAGSWTNAGWAAAAPPPFGDRSLVSLDPATGKLKQRHEWARPGRHVGNGPYILEQWRYKRDLRLRRSRTYHDPDLAQSDTILALTIEDTNTAVLAFESGRVDWLVDVNADYVPDMLEQAAAGDRNDIHTFPTFGTEFYSFNCRETLNDGRVNPFADPLVRRAFVQAIDKSVITKTVTRLNEPTVTTLIPPGSIYGYVSPVGLECDPNAARDALAEAGYTPKDGVVSDEFGNPFPIVDLLYTTNVTRYKWTSLELKAQWERELGVRVELRPAETKFYKEDLKAGQFMIARGRWYGDYGDPTTFLDLCRTGDGNNDRKYSSLRVDTLLDTAAATSDQTERLRLLSECERIIVQEDVPMLFLYQVVQVYMYHPDRLSGLSVHPRLTQFLWQMRAGEPGG